MRSSDLITAARVTWLILCGMMLFSRFVFQAAGAVWMRGFLDAWKYSLTHRIWGLAAFFYGVAVLIGVVIVWKDLGGIDRGVALLLVMILCADGLLNLLPALFGNFKERMQDAWVKRRRGSAKADDKHLFGTVNFFLGFASSAFAVFICLYKPLDPIWIAAASIAAVVLMCVLILACKSEGVKAA